MRIERIHFGLVEKEIVGIFPNSTLDKWNLVPDDIHKLAEYSEIKLQWAKISWWNEFEKGLLDVTVAGFLGLLFERIELPAEGKVIIVTDECFKEKQAYLINSKDLSMFTERVYPEEYKMDFFQPSDIIFVFPMDKLLTILHHEGYTMQFKLGQGVENI